MDNGFLTTFRGLLSSATEYGVKNVPLREGIPFKPFRDDKHRKEFMAACHRGYEKAQNRIVDCLAELYNDKSLSHDERTYRELAYRRVIDSIAFTMLRTECHIARRFVLHDSPPKLDLNVLQRAKQTVDQLNRESRLTFALLADLSTFIHVADILRVDFRDKSEISLIELKSGKVNKILLSQLDQYPTMPEAIDLLQQDFSIEREYLPQAQRILRQRIRLQQIKDVLKYDKGTHIKFNTPIYLIGPTIQTDSYEEVLDNICGQAINGGVGIASIQSCVHIGVGFSQDEHKARKTARDAALFAAFSTIENPPPGLIDVRKEVLESVPEREIYKGNDIFFSNLFAMSSKPFPLWGIKKDYMISLLARNMFTYSIFDLPSFIWLGRSIGLRIGLSNRKEMGRVTQRFRSRQVPLWGKRGIRFSTSKGEFFMGGGTLARIFQDLHAPLQILNLWSKE